MAGKRGNSEGTIRKRAADNRWEARYVGADGKRHSIYGKTRQEVARQLTTALRDREHGVLVIDDHQTVKAYLSTWIEGERYKLRYSAYRRYETVVRLHLIPRLGAIPLAKLTPQHIVAFHTHEIGRGYSLANVRYSHRVLNAALEDAMRMGVVRRNVAKLVDRPRARHRQMAVYNQEQVRTLLEAVAGDRLEALCVLVLATGMRQGEVLALTWQDVDLEGASLQVNANLQLMVSGIQREETKTEHSRRRIALAQAAVEALRQHRVRQEQEKQRVGAAWTNVGLVFPNQVGCPIRANWLRSRWWPRLVRKAGLPYIRFHDLRHTAATLLLSRGVNVKVVSEMLGHANIGITLAIYGHVLPHMQQHAADTMDTLLTRAMPER